jgi:hypothetical protein
MARFADVVATGTGNAIRRVTGLAIGLVFVGLQTSVRPVLAGFDKLTAWTAGRLEEAESLDGLIQETVISKSARDVLGLPEEFSRADIDAKYRKLMKVASPDVGGSTFLASQINAARDEIFERKGWKK